MPRLMRFLTGDVSGADVLTFENMEVIEVDEGDSVPHDPGQGYRFARFSLGPISPVAQSLDTLHDFSALRETGRVSPGRTFDMDALFPGHAARRQPVVVAMDFTGLDGSRGGMLFDFGASVLGASAWFGPAGDFRVRAGHGGALPQPGCASLTLPAGGAPAGDGTLAIELAALPRIALRVFWQGRLLGTAEAGDPAAEEDAWAGGDGGSYLVAGGGGRGLPEGTFAGGLPRVATAGAMRLHHDQSIPTARRTTPPRAVTALAYNGAVAAVWSPPAEGTPSGYRVEMDGAGLLENADPFLPPTPAAPGRHVLRVAAINVDGSPGAWSDPVPVEVAADLPGPAPTTLQSTIAYEGASITLDRPRPAGRFADGSWFVVSDESFEVIDDSPAAGVQVAPPSFGNGMMIDPNYRNGTYAQGGQGFDFLIGAGNDATTRTAFDAALNVAPSAAGPLAVDRGRILTLVKSIRNDQVTDKVWAGTATTAKPVGNYVPFTILPFAPPADAYRPAATATGPGKLARMRFKRHLRLDVLQRLTPPAEHAYSLRRVMDNTAALYADFGQKTGEQINTFMPDAPYSVHWTTRHRFRRWVALHTDTLSDAQKEVIADRVITIALDLEQIVADGWAGISGAGQGFGRVQDLFFAAFLLNDADLLATARTIKSNELSLERHYFTPEWRVGQHVQFPSSAGENNQTWFEAHLDTVMAHTHDGGEGSQENARYAGFYHKHNGRGVLPVMLLRNGPGGISGIRAITGAGEQIGPDNPGSAPIATMDAFYDTYEPGSDTDDFRAYYDAWRAVAGPRYQEKPKQFDKDVIQPVLHGLKWDLSALGFVSGTYASTELRYSLDNRSWTEITGRNKIGSITGLIPGAAYMTAARFVDTLGRKGIWSGTTPRLVGEAPPNLTRPTGTLPAAAPVNTRAPVLTWRPYPSWKGEHYRPLAAHAEMPRDATILYPSVGDWQGYPAPSFRWKMQDESGADLTGWAPFDVTPSGIHNDNAHLAYARGASDFSSATRNRGVRVVVEAANPSGTARATSDVVYFPKPLALPDGVHMDAQFTTAFALDYPEAWDGLSSSDVSSVTVNPHYYTEAAPRRGFLRAEKTGPAPRMAFVISRALVPEQTYRVTVVLVHRAEPNLSLMVTGQGERITETLETVEAEEIRTVVWTYRARAADAGEKLRLWFAVPKQSGGGGGQSPTIISVEVVET